MDEITLLVFRSSSGQWSGTILRGSEELGGIAGCNSPAEVEYAALEMGYDIKETKTV